MCLVRVLLEMRVLFEGGPYTRKYGIQVMFRINVHVAYSFLYIFLPCRNLLGPVYSHFEYESLSIELPNSEISFHELLNFYLFLSQ